MSACTTGCGEVAAPGQEVCFGCEQLAERERQWQACLAAAERVKRREEGFVQGVKTPEGRICEVGGCGRPAKSLGGRLCRACYAAWRYQAKDAPGLTAEQFIAQGRKARRAAPTTSDPPRSECQVAGCGLPGEHRERRLCDKHNAAYKRARRARPGPEELSVEDFIRAVPAVRYRLDLESPEEPVLIEVADFEPVGTHELIPARSFEERLLDRLLAATNWGAMPIAVKRRIGEIVLEA